MTHVDDFPATAMMTAEGKGGKTLQDKEETWSIY